MPFLKSFDSATPKTPINRTLIDLDDAQGDDFFATHGPEDLDDLLDDVFDAQPATPGRRGVSCNGGSCSAAPAPTHRLFDPQDLAGMSTSAKSASSDLAKRDADLISKLNARGPNRRIDLPVDVDARLQQLSIDMPHFAEVIACLRELIAPSRAQGQCTPLPLISILLDGDPGVGKSHFAQEVGEILDTGCRYMPMDNAQTPAAIAGSSRTWSNTHTGVVFDALALGDHLSPVIVLDELDKAPRHSQYDPLSALHGLLEESTAQHYEDASFPLPIDASHVIWIATTNDKSQLPPPLLDRFEVFQIANPTAEQSRGIAQRILTKELTDRGLNNYTISNAALEALSACSPRRQKRLLRRALGRSVLAGRTQVDVCDLHGLIDAALPPARRMGFI